MRSSAGGGVRGPTPPLPLVLRILFGTLRKFSILFHQHHTRLEHVCGHTKEFQKNVFCVCVRDVLRIDTLCLQNSLPQNQTCPPFLPHALSIAKPQAQWSPTLCPSHSPPPMHCPPAFLRRSVSGRGLGPAEPWRRSGSPYTPTPAGEYFRLRQGQPLQEMGVYGYAGFFALAVKPVLRPRQLLKHIMKFGPKQFFCLGNKMNGTLPQNHPPPPFGARRQALLSISRPASIHWLVVKFPLDYKGKLGVCFYFFG